VFMQLTRDLFAIAKFLFVNVVITLCDASCAKCDGQTNIDVAYMYTTFE